MSDNNAMGSCSAVIVQEILSGDVFRNITSCINPQFGVCVSVRVRACVRACVCVRDTHDDAI